MTASFVWKAQAMADGAQQKAGGRQASPDQQAQLADLKQRVQIAQRQEMARRAREVRPCLLYKITCTDNFHLSNSFSHCGENTLHRGPGAQLGPLLVLCRRRDEMLRACTLSLARLRVSCLNPQVARKLDGTRMRYVPVCPVY